MSRDFYDRTPIIWIGAALIILIGIAWWLVARDQEQTKNQIESCIERGGQPIVAGHHYTTDVYCVIVKE